MGDFTPPPLEASLQRSDLPGRIDPGMLALETLKAFRRIATRYEKTDKSFAAMIHLVGAALAIR